MNIRPSPDIIPQILPSSVKNEPQKGSLNNKTISSNIPLKDDTATKKANDKATVVIKVEKKVGEEEQHDFTIPKEGKEELSPEKLKTKSQIFKSTIAPESPKEKGVDENGIKEKTPIEKPKLNEVVQKKPEKEEIDLSNKESEHVPASSSKLPPQTTASEKETKTEKPGPENTEEQETENEEKELEALYGKPKQAPTPIGETPVGPEEQVSEEKTKTEKPGPENIEEQGPQTEEEELAALYGPPKQAEQPLTPKGETPVGPEEELSELGEIGEQMIGPTDAQYKSYFQEGMGIQEVISSHSSEVEKLISENPDIPQAKTWVAMKQKAKEFQEWQGDKFIFLKHKEDFVLVSENAVPYKSTIAEARKVVPQEIFAQYILACKQGRVHWISKADYMQMREAAKQYANEFLFNLKREIDIKKQKKIEKPKGKEKGVPQTRSTYQPREKSKAVKEEFIPKEIKEVGNKTRENIKEMEKTAAKKKESRENQEKLTKESDKIRQDSWKKDNLNRDNKKEEEKKEEK